MSVMREPIYGLPDHPSNQLGAYRTDAPDGQWTGRLDDRAWGKSANLFCYFTDIVSAEGYRLSVFFDKEYRPADGGPAMDLEPLGRMFRITTRQGKKGLSRFLIAEPVDPVA
ncbi:hypothetical protein [Sphingomonas zeae]|uniref:hypothetical protein n=2 Tax=Sphingomonas TaxID=13687 RepID=UPI00254E57E8|nr:hypothetical protein [Sphingomonas zeae]